MQNTNDPLGSSLDIKAAFAVGNNNRKFIELPGDTHDYMDFDTIATSALTIS